MRWLTDKSIEERTAAQPELGPYISFTAEDRASILGLFEQIYSIIAQRKKDAVEARYADLRLKWGSMTSAPQQFSKTHV